ncbi:hypothetical protein HPB50_004165 [Hyalomma asiaticum]|uniref:Uncharacterized protein n=1 Tax=Hyalomma asiaticum TaxID=266040 RepID=A0ACB7SVG3_HYAAI|nr:hypothetical protein HPB50_004165 [Hyalomma asiaticum]
MSLSAPKNAAVPAPEEDTQAPWELPLAEIAKGPAATVYGAQQPSAAAARQAPVSIKTPWLVPGAPLQDPYLMPEAVPQHLYTVLLDIAPTYAPPPEPPQRSFGYFAPYAVIAALGAFMGMILSFLVLRLTLSAVKGHQTTTWRPTASRVSYPTPGGLVPAAVSGAIVGTCRVQCRDLRGIDHGFHLGGSRRRRDGGEDRKQRWGRRFEVEGNGAAACERRPCIHVWGILVAHAAGTKNQIADGQCLSRFRKTLAVPAPEEDTQAAWELPLAEIAKGPAAAGCATQQPSAAAARQAPVSTKTPWLVPGAPLQDPYLMPEAVPQYFYTGLLGIAPTYAPPPEPPQHSFGYFAPYAVIAALGAFMGMILSFLVLRLTLSAVKEHQTTTWRPTAPRASYPTPGGLVPAGVRGAIVGTCRVQCRDLRGIDRGFHLRGSRRRRHGGEDRKQRWGRRFEVEGNGAAACERRPYIHGEHRPTRGIDTPKPVEELSPPSTSRITLRTLLVNAVVFAVALTIAVLERPFLPGGAHGRQGLLRNHSAEARRHGDVVNRSAVVDNYKMAEGLDGGPQDDGDVTATRNETFADMSAAMVGTDT